MDLSCLLQHGQGIGRYLSFSLCIDHADLALRISYG